MALELRQTLKLSQQLVMTPQLQQAIKLLQLSRLELQQAVREELEVNPALEEDGEGAPEEQGVSEEQGASEEQGEVEASPQVAEQDGSASDETPPAQELIDRVDWDYYFGDGATTSGPRGDRDREEEDGRPYYENLLTRKPSLAEYLEMQINLSTGDDAVREIAPYLIGNIDENGYLKVSAEETAEAPREASRGGGAYDCEDPDAGPIRHRGARSPGLPDDPGPGKGRGVCPPLEDPHRPLRSVHPR